MAGQWYYTHAGERSGPFTGQQLFNLAATGDLLPGDTVLKDGNAEWVLASRVRNLFPVVAAIGIAEPVAVVALPNPETEAPPTVDDPIAAATPEAPYTYQPTPRNDEVKKKGVATAVKGADIVGQDGVFARYRMKCIECGHKDASSRSITISNRVTKSSFFCRKCKKAREVVIQCRLG